MTNHQKTAKEFKDILGLQSPLIGVKYTAQPDLRGNLDLKMAACEAIDVVRREKSVVNLTKETCNCVGGQYYLGLAPIPKEQIIKVMKDIHKMFASEELTQKFLEQVPPPKDRGGVVVLAPLSDMPQEPELVLCLCNAEQANKVISLLMYSGLQPFMYNLVSAGCTSLSNSIVTGNVDINFITDHARRRVQNFSFNELVIALPFNKFMEAAANIPYAGAGRKDKVPDS